MNAVYQPQRETYNKYISDLDPQLEAENKGLEAQRTEAFDTITQGANRRGLFFSGIPLGEQAKYTGSQFLPAVANLRGKYAAQKFSLQDAIAKITQDQYLKAQDIYQTELDREAAERAARASGSGGGYGFSPSLGGFGAEGQGAQGQTLVAGSTNIREAYSNALNNLESRLQAGERPNVSEVLRSLYQNFGKSFRPQDITKEINNLYAKYDKTPQSIYGVGSRAGQRIGEAGLQAGIRGGRAFDLSRLF